MMRPYYLVAALIIAFDQATKFLVLAFLLPGQSIALIQNVLYLTYVRNTGAAFGILPGNNALLIAVAAFAALFIIYAIWRLPKERTYYRLGLALILGGSAGNILDRVYRGYVVDMIDFRFFPVFNVADIMINVGMAIVIAGYLLVRRPGGASLQKGERDS